MKLRIAMVAPPWIRLPPAGYGGVETVVHSLVEELLAFGHQVDVMTVGDSTVKGATMHSVFSTGQYERISDPLYDALALPVRHVLMARRLIDECGPFDIVHDHNYLLGPAILAPHGHAGPPVLHTLHSPFFSPSDTGPASNVEIYTEMADNHLLWLNGVSNSQLRDAPPAIRPRLVGMVHNAIDLRQYPFCPDPGDAFLTLARFAPEKGHATAARLCHETGARLMMAGAVGNISSPWELAEVLNDPSSPHWKNREVRHFHEDIQGYLRSDQISYIGAAFGSEKLGLLGRSKALLLPIGWEEPFGVVAVEAMASGTPVIAFARGALPELIEHGVNGFLAETEADFVEFMGRVGEIDPNQCRAVAEERFSASVMARGYETIYQRIIGMNQT